MPALKRKAVSPAQPFIPDRLEDLPNIGKKLAVDLRTAGIHHPRDLVSKDPRIIFAELAPIMGHRHDPCVFYTLLAVKHYLLHFEAIPWWKFSAEGKEILASSNA
ncbi:DNA transformation protein [Prosthecobacter fusiformis]|uniref:DNA transformation protein n=1 Tax=Prosthecobacter fusiformis TaxID=48464 RepID=A0A4R7SRC4_9BACT|nr:helix-hairpin-helix domain-containing protein [Prosthecobacter fusiformis]TDU81225.1 DNA transformation protein [Prosthecobacter fusiformis]